MGAQTFKLILGKSPYLLTASAVVQAIVTLIASLLFSLSSHSTNPGCNFLNFTDEKHQKERAICQNIRKLSRGEISESYFYNALEILGTTSCIVLSQCLVTIGKLVVTYDCI